MPYPLCGYGPPAEPGAWFSAVNEENSMRTYNIGCADIISYFPGQIYLYYFSGGRLPSMRCIWCSRKVMQIQPNMPKKKLSRHSRKE